jgi:hypothetical protein
MRTLRRLVVAALVVGFSALLVTSAQAAPATGHLPAGTPNPGPDYRVKFIYEVAEGTQTYTCEATSTWSAASTPEATLRAWFRPPIHHFGGPRWQAKDGSTVRGTVVEPRVPQEGTIPWLLLTTTVEQPGRALGDVTHISRINTTGGVAPAGSCTPGQTASVPYGADYVFWVHR